MEQRGKIKFTQGLLIAIGFVIGSGIFFRADNILVATQGNVLIAILGWIFLGTTIVFGGLSASVISERATGNAGIGSYIEYLYGTKAGYLVGFFMATIYAPIMISIMSIVFMGYAKTLFGLENLTAGNGFYFTTMILIAIVFSWNFISTKFAARVSSVATIIKVIPLILIGVIGIVFGDPGNIMEAGIGANSAVAGTNPDAGFFVLFAAPFVSMGFAFDGWISVAALSKDMENPRSDLPKILFISIAIITSIYVIYFTGVSMLMDPAQIVNLGDEHITTIAVDIFGKLGGKLLITGILISILGVLNSNIMAGIRYPYATAIESSFMFRDKMVLLTEKSEIPIFGGIYCVIVSYLGLSLFAIQEISGKFVGIAFDDIPVFILSVFYLFIFIGVYKVGRRENLGKFKTVIAPIIGALGQILILIAFYVTNSNALLYTIIIIIVMIAGYFMRNIANKQVV